MRKLFAWFVLLAIVAMFIALLVTMLMDESGRMILLIAVVWIGCCGLMAFMLHSACWAWTTLFRKDDPEDE